MTEPPLERWRRAQRSAILAAMSRAALLVLLCLTSASGLACESRVSIGGRCTSSSDCSGSVCGVGAQCRAGCSSSVECGGGRCLRDPVTGASGCSLASDECRAGGCAGGLRCVDGACLGVCVRALDCPDGVCVDDVCVVPEAGIDAAVSDASSPDVGIAPDAATSICPDGGTLDVDVGRRAVCAIQCDHTVHCWGAWGFATARLTASPDDCGGAPCILAPVEIPLPAGDPPVQIAVGNERACARTGGGAVWCWGTQVDSLLDAPTQIVVAGGAPLSASDLRAGGLHFCARDRASPSSVVCWGWNEQGQLARGDTSHSASAVSTRFADAVLLAPGEWRTHVLSTDGSLRGSGLNDDLEVTSPRSAEVTAPAPGPTLTERPVAIAPLVDQTCVLHEDGEIACWGRSGVLLPGPPPGSTPCGPNICVASPVTLPRGDLPAGPLAGIAGDRFAMLFVVWDAEGRTYGMGEGGGGVLGMDGIDVFAPAQTTALRGARTHHVRLGLVTACAILDDTRELVCWGANDVGQLGRATFGSPEAIAAPPAW